MPALTLTAPAFPRLRVLAAVALCVLSLAACAPARPTIIVDEEHFTAFKQGDFADSYKVQSADGFWLDATGYPFLIPAETPEVPGPNMIQVTTGEGQVYNHPWNLMNTRYELTPENLLNPATGEQFPGLLAGESYLLGIGYLDGNGRFTVLWAAVVDVTRG